MASLDNLTAPHLDSTTILGTSSYDTPFHILLRNHADYKSRVTSEELEQVSRNRRDEFAFFSYIVRYNKQEGVYVDEYEKMINDVYSILTRTPILIGRKNNASLIYLLGEIATIAATIGKIDECIDFMHKVLDEGLYVSQTSLTEHYGNYVAKGEYELPEHIEPWRTTESKSVILASVYERVSGRIADKYYTKNIATGFTTEKFLLEQLSFKELSLRNVVFYPCKLFKSTSDLFKYIVENSDNELVAASKLMEICHNDSVAYGSGLFRYVEQDAKYFNELYESGMGTLSSLGNIQVSEIGFLLKLFPEIPLDYFHIDSSLDNLRFNTSDMMLIIDRFENFPHRLISSKSIFENPLPLEYFVKNIQKLFFKNQSWSVRSTFESQYKVADIIKLLK